MQLPKVEGGLWSFARVCGIDPTNDATEGAMRFAATWRRISESSDSLDGSRFVGRMLTVAATCRQRRHNVLVYLTTCFEAECRGQAIPSLANQPTENQSRLIPLIPPRVRLQSTAE